MVTDASAWEPMVRGGRSPHSGLLAWLARYVKQLLLIWSPQSPAFGGLVRRAVALAGATQCGRRGPRDGAWAGSESEEGKGQARKESSWRRPLASVSQPRGLRGEGVGPARGSQYAGGAA